MYKMTLRKTDATSAIVHQADYPDCKAAVMACRPMLERGEAGHWTGYNILADGRVVTDREATLINGKWISHVY